MSIEHDRHTTDEDLHHRFVYHAPGPKARERHDSVRAMMLNFAEVLNGALPEGREKALFFTKLEEASFWAHAAIARARGGTE